MITQARLKELVTYDPETGLFYRNYSAGRFSAGDRVGSKSPGCYVVLLLDGKVYSGHRLAWLYMTGDWPLNGQIDHDNRKKDDNRWSNLKDVTNQVNHWNMPMRSDNTSGYPGVAYEKSRGKYRASIKIGARHVYLGRYNVIEEAVEARKKAEDQRGRGELK